MPSSISLPWLEPAGAGDASSPNSPHGASLAKLARDDVLAQILRGELGPGQRINEPDVAARLGVSRVPVREALRELESSGLVVARKHAGVFVRELGAQEVADLYDMRALLDGHAGQRAAALAQRERQVLLRTLDDSIARMQAAHRARSEPGQIQVYYSENLRFHWAIVEAAGNAELAGAYRAIVQKLHLSRLKNLSQDVGMRVSIAEHEDIASVLRAGDAAAARELMSRHVRDAHQRLTIPQPSGQAPRRAQHEAS